MNELSATLLKLMRINFWEITTNKEHFTQWVT